MNPDEAFGPLSAHMVQHIVAMNLVAPLMAVWVRAAIPAGVGRWWIAATIVQIALIWGWHAPPALALAMSDTGAMLAMHASLAAGALWFWAAVISIAGNRRWRALVALLVTGKLFCLLGVLFAFAPRSLHGGDLADQQLAGLTMLIACPLSYVLAAILVTARWLRDLERADAGRA